MRAVGSIVFTGRAEVFTRTRRFVSASGSISFAGEGVAVGDPLETPEPPPPSSTGGAQTPPPVPEPQLPPAGEPDPLVERFSERMPAPALDSKGMPINWVPSSTVREAFGRFQIVVEGTDITYWNGAPTASPEWTDLEPFGSGSASIPMPQVTAFHSPGSGSMSWCRAGANVTIRIKPVSGSAVTLFTGVLASFGHDETPESNTFTLTCVGDLFVGDLQLRKPAFNTAPRDIGTVIKRELDSVVSRRYSRIPKKVVGAATSVLGGWEPKITGLAQQLLSTAITKGRQWTVACQNRSPVLVRKNTTTAHWTISNGQRGTEVKLSRDWTQAHNVIYGEGIAPNGGRWRNSKYPNWRPDNTPRYPFNNPSNTIKLGVKDRNTDTGNGVSVWQRRVGRRVTGIFSTGDLAELRSIQRNAGIQVDNSLGPQSWAATFATGSNTGTLDGAWIAPLAAARAVEPQLYASDGAKLGANPNYNNRVIRVERYINFGEGVTKKEGARAAREIVARDSDPGWVGTIKLTIDPEENSRFLIRAGQNIRIRHWRGGGTLLLHIAAVTHSQTQSELTVDTNARDYPTLDAIRNRERQAVDPALAYMKPRGQSRTPQDMPVFDAEAGGGEIPRFALFRNLWTVIRIPLAAYGRIVRTEFRTDSPASPFSVAVFDRPVTAAKLLSIVGNPFNAEENPWQNHADALDRAGLIMAWGWDKQRLGYFPRDYSTPDREGSVPVTGRFIDDASWDFGSTKPPWVWVAAISPSSTYIRGRFWQGTE